jgi:hypothetical protein
MGCEWWWGWVVWGKGEVKGTRVRVRWEVKVGFRVNCRVWGGKSNGGENWGQSMCKTIANSIVNANFADACATFQDVIAKKTTVPKAQIGWLVAGCRGSCSFCLITVSNCQLRRCDCVGCFDIIQ